MKGNAVNPDCLLPPAVVPFIVGGAVRSIGCIVQDAGEPSSNLDHGDWVDLAAIAARQAAWIASLEELIDRGDGRATTLLTAAGDALLEAKVALATAAAVAFLLASEDDVAAMVRQHFGEALADKGSCPLRNALVRVGYQLQDMGGAS